jgi:hypothetical protein
MAADSGGITIGASGSSKRTWRRAAFVGRSGRATATPSRAGVVIAVAAVCGGLGGWLPPPPPVGGYAELNHPVSGHLEVAGMYSRFLGVRGAHERG